jgi:hypothetical protein
MRRSGHKPLARTTCSGNTASARQNPRKGTFQQERCSRYFVRQLDVENLAKHVARRALVPASPAYKFP